MPRVAPAQACSFVLLKSLSRALAPTTELRARGSGEQRQRAQRRFLAGGNVEGRQRCPPAGAWSWRRVPE
ncbi:cytosolic Fe-S cluster assembly factor NUBP2 [Platysternon megacephalum]|uniref:Cytosolic Fe-S cluster assembly factor NUBP2 n=1 Tax=Platysternon megacephalum TaxID=55544 RepID=A0A4D9EF48_9SAUR|nr:cytosolic Fe-S cluster assembly factor NUBP2 [Platysternon megacephalum]